MSTKLDYIGALVSAYAGKGTTNVRSWQHMRDELEDAAPAFIRLARTVHRLLDANSQPPAVDELRAALALLLAEVPDA